MSAVDTMIDGWFETVALLQRQDGEVVHELRNYFQSLADAASSGAASGDEGIGPFSQRMADLCAALERHGLSKSGPAYQVKPSSETKGKELSPRATAVAEAWSKPVRAMMCSWRPNHLNEAFQFMNREACSGQAGFTSVLHGPAIARLNTTNELKTAYFDALHAYADALKAKMYDLLRSQ